MDRLEIKNAHHWVIKIGSGVLLRDRIHVDRPTFVNLVQDVDALLRCGHRVTLVSSGAVALGRQVLGNAVDRDLPALQAFAALGQARLIQMFDQELRQYDRVAAQVLFGRTDLDRREGFLNARMALEAIHRFGAVPVINENDTVATEGLRFDDNDHLAATTCGLVQADILVILSDVEGVCDVKFVDDQRILGQRFSALKADDPKLIEVAGPSTSGHGRGGMNSKVGAARTATRFGVPTIIAPGKRAGVLTSLRNGEDVGTLIQPVDELLQGKKIWLGGGALPIGRLICDEGATLAVCSRGASLLPKGIRKVEGEWGMGSVVDLVDEHGRVFARGLCSYSSTDVRKIAGIHSDSIAEVLGFRVFDSVVHRDNLVLL